MINEVESGDGSFGTKFVELLNNSGSTVNLSDHKIVAVEEGQPCREITSRNAVTLAPGGRHVITTHPSAVGAGATRQTAPSSFLPTNVFGRGTVVALFDAAQQLRDLMGFNLQTGSGSFFYGFSSRTYPEGTFVANAASDSASSSMARVPDGTDTDQTADDWQQRYPTPGSPN